MNIEELEKLNTLKERGALTQEEFDKQKELILSQDETKLTKTEKSIWDYFGLCLTKKYAHFKGRASRKEYWGFFIIAVVLNLLFCGFLSIAGLRPEIFGVLSGIYLLVYLLPWFGVLVRRAHDVNVSGWWLFGTLITPIILLSILAAVGAIVQYTGETPTANSSVKTLFFVLAGFSLLGGFVAFFLIIPLISGSKKENKYGLPTPNGDYNKIFPYILISAVGLAFIAGLVNGFIRATEKYQNTQQSNVSENTSLKGKTNKDIFVNVNSQAFQELLEEGISEYFVYYFSDGNNSPYTGNIYDYIFERPIPLPEQDVVFTENGVIFVYGKGEIAANYLDRIRFFIPYNQLRSFLVILE